MTPRPGLYRNRPGAHAAENCGPAPCSYFSAFRRAWPMRLGFCRWPFPRGHCPAMIDSLRCLCVHAALVGVARLVSLSHHRLASHNLYHVCFTCVHGLIPPHPGLVSCFVSAGCVRSRRVPGTCCAFVVLRRTFLEGVHRLVAPPPCLPRPASCSGLPRPHVHRHHALVCGPRAGYAGQGPLMRA